MFLSCDECDTVCQCEGQPSIYQLNGGSMTTPQSEEVKKEKEKVFATQVPTS